MKKVGGRRFVGGLYQALFSFRLAWWPAKRRRISGRRFSPSENSEGEKRRPEIHLRFAGYLPAGMLFTKRNEN